MTKILLVVMTDKKEEFPIKVIHTIDSTEIEQDIYNLNPQDTFIRLGAQGARNLYECISSKPISNNFIEGHDHQIIAVKKERLSGGIK
ncbi:TPA: hypothetical protein I7264_17140 [Vibrio parahaemolyticus]|uniref:hypothetical protein n=1 Tax=Vibrio harveyi group TaxID=717610 RepID=UPI0004A233C2|nr:MULTISPECIES: hypothetical protein [Vibrio harveyi group]EHH1107982.1 hypothetical protein [Vibrio parahaemolyticus]EJB1795809.1 hypothetical protein [Vibrio parahaemolyticus]EJG0780485.1 hypothetical protein [Vibrio parahaemolyticus]KJR15362.1 hypothetical protein UF28_17025 [Vibrio parahaemolyticus]HAS6613404.1 hypothetical protein [Vibrio parahaemolyticus]